MYLYLFHEHSQYCFSDETSSSLSQGSERGITDVEHVVMSRRRQHGEPLS